MSIVAERSPISANAEHLLWPPCVADADIIFLPSGFFLLFSSPNLSGRRLDVYHTSTHGVALVQISNAGLKCAERRKKQDENIHSEP